MYKRQVHGADLAIAEEEVFCLGERGAVEGAGCGVGEGDGVFFVRGVADEVGFFDEMCIRDRNRAEFLPTKHSALLFLNQKEGYPCI